MHNVISSLVLSQSVTKQTGKEPKVWGVVSVTTATPAGSICDHRIVCCNGDGTGWLYEIADEAIGRDDIAFYEAIEKSTEEPCIVAGELAEAVDVLLKSYNERN